MEAVYGADAGDRLQNAKVLVVGAGGVGCELLKGLGTSGFKKISLIDLDTIDISNLNRQFLFRKEHVGETKAKVAAAMIEKMLKGKCHVEPIVGNVKESRFNSEFFGGFDVVLNALDNLDARRHVNRMCLNAKVPMVESGSTGYLGQVTVVHPNKTECYDCHPVPTPKTFAVCTIRSTPEKPVHCIVWAKQLLELLFGPDDESNLLADLAKDEQNGESSGESKSLHWDGEEPAESFAQRVLGRVFVDDINKQREVAAETWKSRAPPESIDVVNMAKNVKKDEIPSDLLDQRVWSVEENAGLLHSLLLKFIESRSKEIGFVKFDKDDGDFLAFVAAAANLRAKVYGVEMSSIFSVKGIAGNIIHAIATTNAVVASLIVLETIKIVATQGKEPEASLSTYVKRFPNSGRRERLLLQVEKLQPPNKACFVCSKGRLEVEVDLQETLGFLVKEVFRGHLGFIDPSVCVTAGGYLFESGEGLDEDEVELYSGNLAKKLSELGIESGAIFDVTDFSQNVNLAITVKANSQMDYEKFPARFLVKGQVPDVPKDDDGAVDEVMETTKANDSTRKRARSDDGVVHVPISKKGKVAEEEKPIELD